MGAKSKVAGDAGEEEVIQLIKCPNCHSQLMRLPENYPLYDIQCTRCLFRAQIKTNNCKPKDQVFGAGWDIMDRSLRIGNLIPPLIANFKWQEKGESKRRVYFFPFLSGENIEQKTRSKSGQRPGYKEFNYVGLLKEGTPKMILLDE